MKHILAPGLLALASCASHPKGWDMPDPNDRLVPPGEIIDRYSRTVGTSGSRPMSNDEIIALAEPKKEKRFSGTLGFGVGARF